MFAGAAPAQGRNGLGFRVKGFRVQGLGFRVQGFGFRVWGVQGLGFRVQGWVEGEGMVKGAKVLGCMVYNV